MSAAPDPSARQVLEPCPFCGDHDGVYLDGPCDDHPHSAIARCSNCNAVHCCTTSAETIAAWNRRPPDPAVAELVEALQLVRGIIKDAAMEGFNYQYGDWADRLFRSQADTHAVLAKHASPRDAT